MAPEIVAHQTHNYFKSDIWALGVILYSLLSGKFPFKAQNDKDLYNKIRKGYFNLPEGITLEAKSILLSMLQTDPGYRQSTNALLKDPWIIGETIYKSDKSPTKPDKKRGIMTTIEKYKKRYGGNRRNLGLEDQCSSEPRKKGLSTSPYPIPKSPYNNRNVSGALKKTNGTFIQAYFRNSNEINVNKKLRETFHIHKNTKEDIESQTLISKERDDSKSMKRSSKSNAHISYKKNSGIDRNKQLLSENTQKIKNLRGNMINDKQKVSNFINSFDVDNINKNTKTSYGGFHQKLESQKEDLTRVNITKIDNNQTPRASNLDIKILDMMKILGYNKKNIYAAFDKGNKHLVNVYNKLSKERQDAIHFMKGYKK